MTQIGPNTSPPARNPIPDERTVGRSESVRSRRHLREIRVLSPSGALREPKYRAGFFENSENSTLEMLSQPDSLSTVADGGTEG